MNNNLQLTIDRINSLPPQELVKDAAVKANFIRVYDTLWGDGNGKQAYERESVFFMRIMETTPSLQECTRFSIFSAFIDVAICGLSLEQGVQALAYLLPRKIKIGETVKTDGKKQGVYEPRAVLLITGYGEMVMRKRSGQIRHADNPVLVYEGDEFTFSDQGGHKTVSYTCRLPHSGQRIVACFLRITRADGSVDYSVMFEEDWDRLRVFSMKNNRRYDAVARQWVQGNPNELYSSNNGQIDTGFLKAKCIKHAFQSYPKVRLGKATELETQTIDDVDTLYGVQEPSDNTVHQESEATSYAASNTEKGVCIDDNKDDDVF